MAELTNNAIAEKLQATFGEAIEHTYESYGMLTVFVAKDKCYDLIKFLKEDAETSMNFLTTMCGMHYPENAGKEMGLVFHLHNWRKNVRMRVETFFSIENPVMPTFTTLWPTANWMEREAWDFFGIKFEGHPDLRRILNVEDMDYHPMLKHYPLEDDTRTDKDDRFFGRDGHEGQTFDQRVDRRGNKLLQ